MLVPINIPPGMQRNTTEYGSRGRWYETQLVRWYGGFMQPVGGWAELSQDPVTGAGRAIITWRDNSTQRWCAIGTNEGLFAMTQDGAVSDITPVGFAPGPVDASLAGGYGDGDYGDGDYGTPRVSATLIQDAAAWSLDTRGENLVGVMPSDGVVYKWQLDTGTPAAPIMGAPTGVAVLETEEGFLMVLGSNGDPSQVAWCDQYDDSNWMPSTMGQAGTFPIQTYGKLRAGKRAIGGPLLWTDVDVHLASYLGFPLVYGFELKGSGCGLIAPQAVVVHDGLAVWMGHDGFFFYNGFVQPLPSEVADYVFGDINRTQVSKCFGFNNSSFNEAWFFYPSSASTEIDRYVIYNYAPDSQSWAIGTLARLCACDRGVFDNPLMADALGTIWAHETGLSYEGETQPFARSGPLEFGGDTGQVTFTATQMIADEGTLGSVSVEFHGRFYPNGPETVFGPYSLALGSPTDVRLTARQVEIVLLGAEGADWRVGTFRLNVQLRGGR